MDSDIMNFVHVQQKERANTYVVSSERNIEAARCACVSSLKCLYTSTNNKNLSSFELIIIKTIINWSRKQMILGLFNMNDDSLR